MLEFGSAEVRLKLNTDDYDKSLKAIQSDDRCVEICADLNVDGLNKKLQKLDLDCLDLCVHIDKSQIQKSLANIQKSFNLEVKVELDVSTQMAERKLKEVKEKAGSITSTLELQTLSAQNNLNEFKAELESAKALTQDLTASFTAQIEQTINTSSLERSLMDAAQEFRDSGKDIGDSVADEVGKTKVSARGGGIFAGIFRGVQEGIGIQIAQGINEELKDAFNFDFASNNLTTALIRGIKTSGEVIDDVFTTAFGDSIKAATRPINDLAEQLRMQVKDALSKAIIAATKELTTAANFETFKNELGKELQTIELDTQFSRAGNELKAILNDSTKLGNILAKAGGAFFNSISGPLTEFRRETLRTEGVAATVARAQSLSQPQGRADKKALKELQNILKDSKTEELIIVTGGLGGARGLSSITTARKLEEEGRLRDEEAQRVIGVPTPNVDPLRRGRSEEDYSTFFRRQIAASLAPSFLEGFNPDSIELASRALLALTERPEITVKIVGESGGGLLAAEAQEILNALGLGDRVTSIGAGTPVGPNPLAPQNFRNVFSADETLGRAFDVGDIVPETTFINRAGLNLGRSQDRTGRVSGVQVHPLSGYLPTAELQNLINGLPEAIEPGELDQLEHSLRELAEFPERINGDELFDTLQSLRRQFDVLDGELLERAKDIGRIADLLLARKFTSEGKFGGDFAAIVNNLDASLTTAESYFDDIEMQFKNLGIAFDPQAALFADATIADLDKLRDDILTNLLPTRAGLEKDLLNEYLRQIEEIREDFGGFTIQGAAQSGAIAQPRQEVAQQLSFIDEDYFRRQNEISDAVETSQQVLQANLRKQVDDFRQLSVFDLPKASPQQANQRRLVQPEIGVDQLSRARKAAGQELQILTAQIKNAREQNISSLAFEVVNSLKNLNVQIFKTEQALLDLQAPSFDTPEIPQLNETVQGASELIAKIRGEFDSLFMGVADLNQRIRNQRLPDLLGDVSTPSSAGVDEGFNKVIQSVFEFGRQIEEADSSLGVQFLDIRDTFIKLGQSIGSADFTDNLNKASLSLFEFSKNADLADPRALDSFAAVGTELQKFERRLQDTAPEQPQESGIAASLRMVSEEASKTAIALNEASEKAKLFEPPDLGDFIEAPFRALREEVSRTAQLFGLATNETTAFGGAVTLAKEKLEQLRQFEIKAPELTTTDLQEQADRAGMKLRNLSDSLDGFGELQIKNNIQRVNDSAIELEGAVVLLEKDLKRFTAVAGLLAPLQEKLFDAVKFLADGVASTGAVLSVAGPSIASVSNEIIGLDQSLIPTLRAFTSDLPKVVGALDGIAELGVVAAKSLENLQQKVESFKVPEIDLTGVSDRLDQAFDRLIKKIDSVEFGKGEGSQTRQIEDAVKEVALDPVFAGDPQAPAIDPGSFDAEPLPISDNKVTQQIAEELQDVRDMQARKVLEQINEERRSAISTESRAELERKLEQIRRAGSQAIVDSIGDGVLRFLISTDKTDAFSASFAPIREALSQQNPELLQSILKNIDGTKRQKGAATKDIRRVIETGLGSDDLGDSFQSAIDALVENISRTLTNVANGQDSTFKTLEEFLKNRFKPEVAQNLAQSIKPGSALNSAFLITKDQFDPIINENKAAFREIREKAIEAFKSGGVGELSPDAIKDLTSELEILARTADQVGEVLKGVSESPLISGSDRRSILGNIRAFEGEAQLSREQLIPALQLSAGQLPDASQLEGLLGRLGGDSGLVASARDTGDEFAAGIIEGIKQGLPKIADTGDEAALRLLQSIRDTLGIASPAKRVIELMKFVVQGVQVGLDKGKNAVQGAFNKLVDFGQVRNNIDVGESATRIQSPVTGNSGTTKSLDEISEATGRVDFGFSQIGMKIRELQDRFPILQNLRGLIGDIVIGFGSLVGVFSAGDIIVELFRNSITAAKELQRTTNAVAAAIGSAVKAAQGLKSVEMLAKDLSISLVAARDGFRQLSASAKSTELTGEVEGLFEGISTASAALQLAPEQVDRAFTAIGQIISKGVVSQEELRQQLSEAIPGSIQIFADALGVPVPKLNELIESGGLLAKDVLPLVGRQFRLEFASSIAQASDSLPALDQRLKNSAQLLQENLGKGAIPLVSTGLKVLTTAVEFLNDRGSVLLTDFIGGAVVAFAGLNARFGILNKTAGLLNSTIGLGFRQAIGTGLRVELAQTNAALANTDGLLERLPLQAKKARILAQGFGVIARNIGAAVAKAGLLSLAFQGVLEISDQLFGQSQFVEEIQKSGKALDVLNDKLKTTGETLANIKPPDNLKNALEGLARLNFGDTSDSLTKAALDFDKTLTDNNVLGNFGSRGSQDVIGQDFRVGPLSLLPATKDQREAQQILISFAENQNKLTTATGKASQALKEFRDTGVAPTFEEIETLLAGLEPTQKQLEGFKELGKTDARFQTIFEQLGGDASLQLLQKTTEELKSLNKNAGQFAGTLVRLSSTLKDLELEELENSTKLAEDLAMLGSSRGLEADELRLGFAESEVERLQKAKDLLAERLEIEKKILETADFQQRLARGEKSAVDQADKIKNTEKELLRTRSELASKTTELLEKERERNLNVIQLLMLEKELVNAKTRNSRISGAQETAFTSDLDEIDNLNKIAEARDRLAEFESNGSEEEILNAEKALTDAIANEENRRLEAHKKARQNQVEFTKVLLKNESVEIARELNSREITQVQADRKLSELRQRELAESISNLESQRQRLSEDFANAPQTEGNLAQFQEQLNSINNSLIDESKALFEEQTNFKIAEEDRFLEKAQKASEMLINADKVKTDALIRNLQRVDGESEALLRTLDRQEKSLQSQFDLINAQQGRAVQRFDIAISGNDDARSALDLLKQEEQTREEIRQLRSDALNASKEEREGIREQAKGLEEQLLSLSQAAELRRQLRETTGSSAITEEGLLKQRIKLEEQSTIQRANALAAELQQERALLQISIQRDQLAAKAATRQAQQGVIQSQFQATEQQQGILRVQREISIAQSRGETDQVNLLESQLQVAKEGLKLTQEQISLSAGILRDSQLAEIDTASLGQNVLDTLDISQGTRVEGFLGDEESRRRQFNLSTIQSGGEDFIGESAAEASRRRFREFGVDFAPTERRPSVQSSAPLANTAISKASKATASSDAAIKQLDNTVRVVAESVIRAIEQNALKLPKQRSGTQQRPTTNNSSLLEDQLRGAGL